MGIFSKPKPKPAPTTKLIPGITGSVRPSNPISNPNNSNSGSSSSSSGGQSRRRGSSGGGGGGGSKGYTSPIGPTKPSEENNFSTQLPSTTTKASSSLVAQLTGRSQSNNPLVNAYNKNKSNSSSNGSSTKGVTTFISSEKAKDNVSAISTGDKIRNLFNQSSDNSFLTNAYSKKETSKTQTTKTPTLRDVQGSYDQRGTFGTIFNTGKKPSITADEFVYATKKVNQVNKNNQFRSDYDFAFGNLVKEEESKIDINKYQARINAGGDYGIVSADYKNAVDNANLRLSNFSASYPKFWSETKGKNIDNENNKIEFSSEIYAQTKQAQSKAGGYFKGGFLVGAGAGGLSLALPKVATKTAGKVLFPLFLADSALTVGKSAFSGVKVYNEARDLNIPKWESAKLGLNVGANSASGFAFGGTGAVAGGGLVIGGARAGSNLMKYGSLKGLSKDDFAQLNKLMNRENGIKQTLVKGSTSESQALRIAVKESGDMSIMDTLNKGGSFRKYKLTINDEGLSPRENKLVKKLNFRGDSFRLVDSQGNFNKGFDVTRIKTGRLTKIVPTKDIISMSAGTSNGDKQFGLRFGTSKQGRAEELFTEALMSTGKVKYAKGGFLRGEFSQGTSKRLKTIKFDNGKLLSIDTRPQITTSKDVVQSKLVSLEPIGKAHGQKTFFNENNGIININKGNVFDVGVKATYKDVYGLGKSGNKNSFFDFTTGNQRTPKGPTSSSNGQALKTITQFDKTTFNLPISGSVKSIGLNKVVTPKGLYGNSIYAGSSYGLHSGQSNGPLNIRSAVADFTRGFKSSAFSKGSSASEQTPRITGRMSSTLVEETPKDKFFKLPTGLPTTTLMGGKLEGRYKDPFVFKPRSKSQSRYRYSSAIGLGTPQATAMATMLGTKQMQKLKPLTPTSPRVIFEPFNPSKPTPLGFPKFPFMDYELKDRGKKGKGFKTRYTPNIASIGLGIKATKIPISYYKGAGGIAIRPMIIGKRRRKKR